MARKYYRKRYYRKRRILKKSSIFGKKSAKSQAKQIYALNKKINRVEKLTKPEILVHNCPKCNEITIDCRPDAEPAPKTLDTLYGFLISDLKHSQTNHGYTNFAYTGKLCRVQNMVIYHTMEMSRSPQSGYDSAPQDAYVRITYQKIFKNLDIGSNMIKLHNNYSDGAFRVKGPLSEGITAQGKIIYDKVFKLDDNHTKKIVKINFKHFNLRNPDQNELFDAGELYYNITVYNATGYSAVPSPALVKCSTGVKLAYIDEDRTADTRERDENDFVSISS